MNTIIKKQRLPGPSGILIMLIALLCLSGCSGGDSSSGSDEVNIFSGSFEGGGDTDFTLGKKTLNGYAPTKIVIRPQGKVEISDGSPNTNTRGSLSGDKFETSGKFAFTKNAVSCDFSVVYGGAIKLDNGIATATGKVSGEGQCNSEPASFTGVFTARNISDITKSPVNSGFEDNFRLLF